MPFRAFQRSNTPRSSAPPSNVPPSNVHQTLRGSHPRWKPRLPPRAQLIGQARTAGLWLVGIVLGSTLLGLVWPRGQQGSSTQPGRLDELAKAPLRPVTVLVIGVDAESLGAPINKAAPAGPANADALLLLRLNPSGPVQVLQLPTSVAVQLPGQKRPQSLASLYRTGGPALTADAVRELVGLPSGQPDRYLRISRAGLRTLVDSIGPVEANVSRSMRHADRSQNLTINLQSGIQQLKGLQMEHLARWRDPGQPLESRLKNHQEVVRSIHHQLSVAQASLDLPALLIKLKPEMESNLSRSEALSLMSVALGPASQLTVSTLPLEPPSSDSTVAAAVGDLRERVSRLPDGFWTEPPAQKP